MIFRRIYFFFFTYMAAVYFSQNLLIFWLFKNGFSFADVVIYYGLTFFVAIICILYFPKHDRSSKKSILLGIIFSLFSFLVLIKIFSSIQLYLSAVLLGLNVLFFWIPNNIMYFKYSSIEKRGTNSGMFFLIMPIIGVTLQPLAGLVAEKFGFEIMFLFGAGLYLLPIFLVRLLPEFKWNLDIKKELSDLKFNWTIFFQGVSSRINSPLIPLFTLFFIKSPSNFGSFLGYLALVAAIASVLNGYISDKLKSRKYFFYIFTSLAVLSFLPLAFVSNIYLWGLFAGIASFCLSLANPFWFAFSLDHYHGIGVQKTIVLREVFLNLGYTLGLLLVFFVFYLTSSTKISLIAISLICIISPVVSYFQKVYRNKNLSR